MRISTRYVRSVVDVFTPVTFGLVCWVALWASINTGPWNISFAYLEQGSRGLFNGLRAAFPLALLAAWLFHVLIRRRHAIRRVTLPEALWLYYGLICLISAVYTAHWFDWAYWGFAYLSAFAAVELYLQDSPTVAKTADLNRLSWIIVSLILLIVVWAARGQLLVTNSAGVVSGYGVVNRVGAVAGMAMVRSSGLSRMAAVPAIVAFAALWLSDSFTRLIWAAIFLPCAYLVWVMQSRGSLVSFAAALSLIMILLEGRVRIVGIFLGLALLAVFMLRFIPQAEVHNLYLYATRGAQGAQLESMSGRVHIFHDAWKAIWKAPFIGYGPQADHQIPTIGNAQNGVLYALLCGGFTGGLGYVGGLVVAWMMLLAVLRHRHLLTSRDRLLLLQVTGIMAFFTVRTYPENCAALFSVDLLVQLPAIVYIGELYRALSRIEAADVSYSRPLTQPSPFILQRQSDVATSYQHGILRG